MEKNKVLNPRSLPTKPPITISVVTYLLLDKLNAVGWVRGVVWTIIVIFWLGFIFALFKEQFVSIGELYGKK